MYKRLKETYKPQYEPHIRNNNKFLKESHNCYSYFLNDINNNLSNIYKQQPNEEIKKSLNPQPGHYCGMTKLVNYNETTCKSLIERVLCDNPDIQFIEAKDNNSFNCPPNYYKGALNGVYKSYYINGNLKIKTFYTLGKVDSTFEAYYFNVS